MPADSRPARTAARPPAEAAPARGRAPEPGRGREPGRDPSPAGQTGDSGLMIDYGPDPSAPGGPDQAQAAADDAARRRRRWSRLGAGLTLAGSAIVLASILPLHDLWAVDLLASFQIQALVALILGLIVLGVGHRRGRTQRWATASLLVGVVALAIALRLVAPLLAPLPAPGLAPDSLVRVMVANIHYTQRRTAPLLDVLAETRPEVVALLEVSRPVAATLATLEDYPFQAVQARGDAFGVAVLSRLPLEAVEILDLVNVSHDPTDPGAEAVPPDPEGRQYPSIAFTVRDPAGRPVRMLATHPPPPNRLINFRRRNRALRETGLWAIATTEPAVVLGDLNVTPFSDHFRQLQEAAGLVNGARGAGLITTFPALLPAVLRIPIDHVLVTPELAVADLTLTAPIGSDHRAIVATLGRRLEPQSTDLETPTGGGAPTAGD